MPPRRIIKSRKMFGSKNKIMFVIAGAVVLLMAVFLHVRYFSSEEVNEPVAIEAPADEPISRVSDSTPLYKGDAIDNIGNDPFIGQTPPAIVEKHKNRLLELKEILAAKNPEANDAEAWLEVGLLKKFFNNYKGARDAWEYAKIVNPNFSTPYYNLGGLYGAYLKDNLKAEENYLKAIEIDPVVPYLYFGIVEFYQTFYREKYDQIPRVLASGLSQLITSQDKLDFKLLLARYYNEILSADPENETAKRELKKLTE